MANKLHRLLSFSRDITNPKLGLEFEFTFTRCLCSSAPAHLQEKSGPTAEPEGKEENINGPGEEGRAAEALEAEEEEEEEEEEEGYVNKVTGEVGGPKGPEPTRFGDWERRGRCSDF